MFGYVQDSVGLESSHCLCGILCDDFKTLDTKRSAAFGVCPVLHIAQLSAVQCNGVCILIDSSIFPSY